VTRRVGVIDIGKTNAKFAVVDLATRTEIAVRTLPNRVLTTGPYPHFDIAAIWDFLCTAIAELAAQTGLEALSITTHGASGALVDEAGALVLPVLDYEFAGPDTLAAEYEAVRPKFSSSFSPRLPGGLNLAAQFFWQARKFPQAFARARWLLPYPQYWAMRLTGVAASELTSLGCHTDLWDFARQDFSGLVDTEGWREKFAPVRRAAEVLGPVRPELADRLGLAPGTPVLCGIHDSNASLYPHILSRTPPFAVVSTGTWVIVCAPDGDMGALDARRDSLANIDALGRPVPSARFMGGREYSQIAGERPVVPDAVAVRHVLDETIMLLPTLTPGTGPFPDRVGGWRNGEPHEPGARQAALAFYLALMTATSLELAGAVGEIVVEGPFARNGLYLDMLGVATGRPVVASLASATGTSIGAALLAQGADGAVAEGSQRPAITDPAWADYARAWANAVTA